MNNLLRKEAAQETLQIIETGNYRSNLGEKISIKRKCLPMNVPDGWTIEKKTETALLIRRTSPISAI